MNVDSDQKYPLAKLQIPGKPVEPQAPFADYNEPKHPRATMYIHVKHRKEKSL